ncbi:hypothetical protein HAX54_038527, partial [Datura stramonium]|nr:hypothetical protein [Datura stramonium]
MSVREKLTLGDCLYSAFHRHFVDRDQRIADESLVESLIYLCSTKCLVHRHSRVTSCGSSKFHR